MRPLFLLYIALILFGLFLVIVAKGPNGIIPRDVLIASALSNSPKDWHITLSEDFKSNLKPADVKSMLLTSLARGASLRKTIKSRSLVEGVVLICLALIGLLREKKLKE